jgi:hypothetical protein
VNSTSRRITAETYQRASDAIAIKEAEGAEFSVWWDRLAGLNQGISGPQTWRRLKEITEKLLGGHVQKTDTSDDYAE